MVLLRAPLPAIGVPETEARVVGASTVIALAALAAVGFAFATDSASFDGARWHVAQAAVAKGWPVRRVAGGFEWRAYRRGDRYEPPGPRPPLCVVVRIDPRVPRDRIVAVVASTAPTRRTMHLVAYRTGADCPVPATTRRPVP
jgi:hypothetical protein